MSQNQDRPGNINGTYLIPFQGTLYLRSGHLNIEGNRVNYQELNYEFGKGITDSDHAS